MMIVAIGVNAAAYVVSSSMSPVAGLLVGLVALVAAVIGVLRVTGSLDYSTPRKAIYVAGLLIPLIAIVVLAVVSSEATKALRANGYEVGFFGAKGV